MQRCTSQVSLMQWSSLQSYTAVSEQLSIKSTYILSVVSHSAVYMSVLTPLAARRMATLLDRDPVPPPKGAQPPIFGPCLLWSNRSIDQDATWYGGRPRPKPRCVRWGPIPQKRLSSRITWLNCELRAYNLTLNEAVDVAQNQPLWRLMSTYGATYS